MFSDTNIKIQLQIYRAKRIEEDAILAEIKEIFLQNQKQREEIFATLTTKPQNTCNNFDFELLQSENIFHLNDIKKICIDYRLRFLDAHYFKGEIPGEAISIIRDLEKKHHTSLNDFKIVAPAKLLKLENADDPLLFASMGNDYFYLIHKWGRDLHPFRKLLMWPYKNFENLAITVIFISILITLLSPMHWFSQEPRFAEYIFLFFVVFNSVGGMVIFFGFALGKNFNDAIWKSKYYNA